MYTRVYFKGNRLCVNVTCLTYLTVDQLGSHVTEYDIVYCLCMILRRIKDFLVAKMQKLASAACISESFEKLTMTECLRQYKYPGRHKGQGVGSCEGGGCSLCSKALVD